MIEVFGFFVIKFLLENVLVGIYAKVRMNVRSLLGVGIVRES